MPQFETSTYLAQIVWLILCFFSLWFAMSVFIIPKIDDIIKQRREKIDGYIQKAEKINKKALSSLDKYETALKKAKDEASDIIKQNNEALAQELSDQRNQNQQLLSDRIAQNNASLDFERNQTLEVIDDMSLALAQDILQKVGFEDVSVDQIRPYIS